MARRFQHLLCATLAWLVIAPAVTAAPGPEAPFKPADTGPHRSVAIFAGGCFWCVEEAFDHIKGVTQTINGYTGGHVANPSYEDVTSETSGHFEAVKVIYDPAEVGYAHLLQVFWHNIDPTDDKGQFCDRGSSYRARIFAVNPAQMKTAEHTKETLVADADAPHPITTQIVPATTFYPAESYHQNYYEKNPLRYKFYRNACGRDRTLDKLWGDQARKPAS
ncbi:peptide-methionine (S)-S-oxide reductase MsrA [Salinisphaera sp. Q1T1-3]|uniref:peptide-methionine (S)-S-oxide reductase MsrA n=1 Tax=Salinisphaera sp. Q1T1-3 TaxID=2321229 RepID=UPI000E7403A2|nr:peptide-methionine (S)-S-oxide reductase MsrA [Salinisphaera sp. Q1T1-3]RJS94061.1 peptide-methionine (S)-S-oxide reductase [Salinisphaera sp. Q1T1-3]